MSKFLMLNIKSFKGALGGVCRGVAGCLGLFRGKYFVGVTGT